ncbi:MAG TPA: glycosyltransferase, partial [Solirubrobacteraceae bacterium]|nr:glycosyltransferase [Solirubrobacteraceae bacterium]
MPAPDVTLISPYPPGGERHAGFSGVAGYTARLASALADRGADVAVVAPAEDGAAAREHHGSVRVERRFARGPGALPRAAAAARATGAPVTHLQHETFLYGGPASVPGLPHALRTLGGAVVTMHHVVDP